MKRYLLALALLLVGGAGLNAQTVTVTGHMKSGNTSNVTSKAFMRFRLRNFSGNTPRVTSTGAIVQTQFDVSPDNTGTVTTTIYANDFISPVNTFWTVETWYNGVFQFSYNYGICASTQVTYCSTVGATFNLDSASPISFPTPPAPYLPLPGPTGPTGPQGPIGPQGPPGAGGSGPTLQTNNGTNASQTLLNLLNGSNVTMTNSGGGVTVNAVPATPAGCLQYDNAGAFGGASGICTPDGNQLAIKGNSPWSDIAAFGAAATNGPTRVTAECTSGNPQITIGNAGLFTATGQGVTVQGCGASVTMSTPSAPTVTPQYPSGPQRDHLMVNSPTGSSTYIYCIVAEDKGQGLTPCSPTTTIANGPAALGELTATISSEAVSSGTLTVNTSSGTFVNGMVVDAVSGVPRFSGMMKTNTGTTNSFTVAKYVNDDRVTPQFISDIPNSTSVAGSVNYYQANTIKWTIVTGARRYWICAERPGDASLHVIGVSDMTSGNWQGNQFEDWGSAFLAGQNFPFYITDSICTGSGQPDSLTTTVVSGVGTTTPTLAANPSQTNLTNTLKATQDSGPALVAAVTQSNNGKGCIYIPPQSNALNQFRIESFTSLPANSCIIQGGGLALDDTLEINNARWFSWNQVGPPAFGTQGGATVLIQAANPAVHITAESTIDSINFNSTANAVTAITTEAALDLEKSNCILSSANDTLGICVQYRGLTGGNVNTAIIDGGSFTSGLTQTTDASWTPLIDDGPAQNGSGVISTLGNGFELHTSNLFDSRRTISYAAGGFLSLFHHYIQGPIEPIVMFSSSSGGGTAPMYLNDVIGDTTGVSVVADLSTVPVMNIHMDGTISASTTNPVFSGTRPLYVRFGGWGPANIGSFGNIDNNGCLPLSVITGPYEGSGSPPASVSHPVCTTQSISIQGGGYPFIAAPLSAPATPTVSGPSAGGSIPVGTYQYAVSATGFDGGETMPSPVPSSTITTTTGNQTVTVSGYGVVGAKSYNIWRCNTASAGGCFVNANGNLPFVSGPNWFEVAFHQTGTSFNDTVASPTNNLFAAQTATGISQLDPNEALAPEFVCPETTAPSGVAGFDISYCDSTAHQWKDINNNGTAQSRAGFTITPTNTDCVDWSGTGGLLGDTGGKCGHYTITPTNGDCVTWSGTGGLLGDAGAPCGASGGGMDTNMDNMANPTLMNHSLVPASANTIAVGTQLLPFTNIFLGTVANQAGSFDMSALTANHVIKFPNADSTAVQNCASVSHEWISQILQSTGACTQTQPTLADVSAGASPAGLFNFSGSTMEIPQGAGFTAASNSTLGIDTTAKALHSWINAADSFVASFASAPAGSKCAQTSGTIGQLTEAAAACGTTTPSSTETPTNKNFNAEGTGNALSEPVRAYFGAGGCNNSTASNGFDIGVTNAPTPQCAGTTVRKGVLQFARGNVAYLNFHASSDINLSASVDLEICFTTTDTTNGHVTSFGIQTGFNKTDGTVTDDPTLNATQALSVTTGASQTSGGELCGKLTGLTTTGAAADYNFEIAITRNNTGTDTNTDTAVAVKSAEVIYGVTKNAANR